MAGDRQRSHQREGWVIPSGTGSLWTDRVFETEAEAASYVEAYWRKAGWSGEMHKPVRAKVFLTAIILGGPHA